MKRFMLFKDKFGKVISIPVLSLNEKRRLQNKEYEFICKVNKPYNPHYVNLVDKHFNM